MADDDTTDNPADETAEAGRWAVYDTTLLRFVGGVHTKKPTKKQAEGLAAEGHEVEVRAL